jgi:hypothetical protein
MPLSAVISSSVLPEVSPASANLKFLDYLCLGRNTKPVAYIGGAVIVKADCSFL